jgi:hypothetical protein
MDTARRLPSAIRPLDVGDHPAAALMGAARTALGHTVVPFAPTALDTARRLVIFLLIQLLARIVFDELSRIRVTDIPKT